MTIKKIILSLLVILLLAGIVFAWIVFGPTIHSEKKYLYINSGSNYTQVEDSLRANGLMNNLFFFKRMAEYTNYPQNVKPGKYKITKGMSMYQLIKMLRSGRQEPVNFVITKLRTKEDLAKKIGANFETDSLHAIEFLNNNDSILQFEVDSNTVMTNVIPNTYTFNWTTSIENIYSKFFKEKNKFWNKERLEKAANLQLSPKEVYILASLVEEETNKQEDKGKIASVYINRMKKGMRLAADPTIKFAMKDFSLKRIYHKYLDYPSPYNTYINSGLPPGPICTPSIKTIDAVLNSPETDYLFFVARSDFSGYSDFSSSYQQHLIYAKAYQQALDQLMQSKDNNP
ncbi:MAG: endolytic transglycosylase MltG [Ginsengibacter sp.]|jgi:UPF0755 protein